MKTNLTKKQITLYSIGIICIIFLFTPYLRNFTIHAWYGAIRIISPSLRYQLSHDLECNVQVTEIPQNELMELYPEEYEDIVWFTYDIEVKNISSGYIKIDGSPEVSIQKDKVPYIHFLERRFTQAEEDYRNNRPEPTPEEQKEYDKKAKQALSFVGERLRKWETQSFSRKYVFYKHKEIADIEPYIIRFYVDYAKNNTWARAKFCTAYPQ